VSVSKKVEVTIRADAYSVDACAENCPYLRSGDLCALFPCTNGEFRILRYPKSGGNPLRCPACRKAEVKG